jgi:hypothetical protein
MVSFILGAGKVWCACLFVIKLIEIIGCLRSFFLFFDQIFDEACALRGISGAYGNCTAVVVGDWGCELITYASMPKAANSEQSCSSALRDEDLVNRLFSYSSPAMFAKSRMNFSMIGFTSKNLLACALLDKMIVKSILM